MFFFFNLFLYFKGYKFFFVLVIVLVILLSLIIVIGLDCFKEMMDFMVKGLVGNIDLVKIGYIVG